jgi:hypothetical protein
MPSVKTEPVPVEHIPILHSVGKFLVFYALVTQIRIYLSRSNVLDYSAGALIEHHILYIYPGKQLTLAATDV